jgi:hypothetical protein
LRAVWLILNKVRNFAGAVSLHGMLDIPEELKVFVNDYKMLLVEARQNDLRFHNANNVDFFNMMRVILDKSLTRDEAKKKVIEYTKKHHVDKLVIMTVAGAANCKIDYNALSRKGDMDMCTLFDEIAKESEIKGKVEGKAEGKAEGIIETGFECGLSESDILEKLQKKLNVSLQVSEEYIRKFRKRMM